MNIFLSFVISFCSFISAQVKLENKNLNDSTLLKGEFVEEKYENGVIKSRGYKIKNVRNGAWYFYNQKGVINHMIIFKMGKIYFEKYYNHKNNEKIIFSIDSIH